MKKDQKVKSCTVTSGQFYTVTLLRCNRGRLISRCRRRNIESLPCRIITLAVYLQISVKDQAIYYLLISSSNLLVLLIIFSFHLPPPLLVYERKCKSNHIFSKEERETIVNILFELQLEEVAAKVPGFLKRNLPKHIFL